MPRGDALDGCSQPTVGFLNDLHAGYYRDLIDDGHRHKCIVTRIIVAAAIRSVDQSWFSESASRSLGHFGRVGVQVHVILPQPVYGVVIDEGWVLEIAWTMHRQYS